MNENLYLIYSLEHDAWWGNDRRGYVERRYKAGKYTFEEALKIVSEANIGLHDVPNEAMIKAEEEDYCSHEITSYGRCASCGTKTNEETI